jgi:hypothetical protein
MSVGSQPGDIIDGLVVSTYVRSQLLNCIYTLYDISVGSKPGDIIDGLVV